MIQYATTDDLRELTNLVRNLQGDVVTLNSSVGELDTLVERINHITTLKDVTITFLTEGDLLQYSKDGTWHNVSPALLADYISGEGGIVDTAVVKTLIAQEGSKLFLSKIYDDVAGGTITFQKGIISSGRIFGKEDLVVGNFITGFFGTGTKVDKLGNIEATSLTLREFLSVPELRFNRIDVVSGELWNSIAFGTIESVDTKDQIATLKLEDGEYGGLHVNDICRGIWHNISGVNETNGGTDECGFEKMQGFSTSYFTPIEILDDHCKRFRYSLKPNSTQHPAAGMKFAVYGNFLDTTRQYSAYSTRSYQRYLKNVNTWIIDWSNIASQFGDLEGLIIPGAPDDGQLHGNGAYLNNVYMTDAIIKFDPLQADEMKGQDAYSVNLTTDNLSVITDNQLNILDEYNQLASLQFGVQAFKGKQELQYSDVYGKDHYMLSWTANGCTVSMANGVFTITRITSTSNKPYIDIIINCEGNTQIKKTVSITFHLQGDALWSTYNDNDSIPDRPTGDGTTNGWHRNYTASAIWMSTKRSIYVDDSSVQWSDPNRFRGASVAGKDGEYTRFVYTQSSVKPSTPTGSTVPPVPSQPNDTCVWQMDPPQGDPEKGIWVWQSIQTVYPDKTTSGWSEPFRLTGADGKDGTDGADIEFVYKLTQNNVPPVLLANSNKDDYKEPENGWYDNPQGVSETWQYEWVAQRTKAAAKTGTGTWGNWQGPTIWSKWGEKGMDGDGYEYIYGRTTAENIVPATPIATTGEDEEYPKFIIKGQAWDGKSYWTDDPQGVRENLMFEWVSTRKKTDGVWSNFQIPSIWAKWGETGLSGGNYIFNYKISPTKPNLPKPNKDYPTAANTAPAEGWSINDNLVPSEGQYVWSIQRFKNPDGSLTPWTQLMRITGADGKDGEDGNSVEFVYARNNTKDSAPATPVDPNGVTDWTGKGPDGTQWYDNPQGVSDALRYEYVSTRSKDRSTQKWSAFSTPGLWSVFGDKGKDGDGYEYIYARFSNYDSVALCDKGETYYPASPSYGAAYINGDYQSDDHIPTKTCKGVNLTYTDDGIDVTTAMPYQVCWTRKKKDGVWGDWGNGCIWTYLAKDGQDGADGDKGDPGDPGQDGADGTDGVDGWSYTMSGAPSAIRSRLAFLQTTSCTLRAIKTNASGVTSQASGYFSAYYYSAGQWNKISSSSNVSTFNVSWSSSLSAIKFWFGFCTDASPSPSSQWTMLSVEAPVVYDGDKGDPGSSGTNDYTIHRDRGYWKSGTTYYANKATVAMSRAEYSKFQNYQNLTVIDYVQYKGLVYLAKADSTGKTPPNDTYWIKSDKLPALVVNDLLANQAKLGNFSFSNNVFTSSNGVLYMDSTTGTLVCTNATISGDITTNRVISKDSNGNKIASMNEFNDGAYIQYYPSGRKQMEFNAGNITYYNDDATNSVEWVLGKNGSIDKSRWYWTSATWYYNKFKGDAFPSGQLGNTTALASKYDELYVTTDLSTVVSTYKTSARKLVASSTNTNAQYNGMWAVSPGDNTEPANATKLPSGLYVQGTTISLAMSIGDGGIVDPGGGSSDNRTWYARRVYWVDSNGKITKEGTMEWTADRAPSTSAQVVSGRRFRLTRG